MSASNTSTKDRLAEEFTSVVAEAEHLMQSAASIGSEKATALRDSLEQSIAAAREELRCIQKAATDRTLAAAHATDSYIHQNPWQAIGIAAGVSVALGTLIGLSLNRR